MTTDLKVDQEKMKALYEQMFGTMQMIMREVGNHCPMLQQWYYASAEETTENVAGWVMLEAQPLVIGDLEDKAAVGAVLTSMRASMAAAPDHIGERMLVVHINEGWKYEVRRKRGELSLAEEMEKFRKEHGDKPIQEIPGAVEVVQVQMVARDFVAFAAAEMVRKEDGSVDLDKKEGLIFPHTQLGRMSAKQADVAKEGDHGAH